MPIYIIEEHKKLSKKNPKYSFYMYVYYRLFSG